MTFLFNTAEKNPKKNFYQYFNSDFLKCSSKQLLDQGYLMRRLRFNLKFSNYDFLTIMFHKISWGRIEKKQLTKFFGFKGFTIALKHNTQVFFFFRLYVNRSFWILRWLFWLTKKFIGRKFYPDKPWRSKS